MNNKLWDFISLVEAFLKSELVFATYLPKSVKGTRIIAMIEWEEIDNALKKRIRTIQEPVIGAFNDNNVDVTHKHALSK
jgi:hypothetical protein